MVNIPFDVLKHFENKFIEMRTVASHFGISAIELKKLLHLYNIRTFRYISEIPEKILYELYVEKNYSARELLNYLKYPTRDIAGSVFRIHRLLRQYGIQLHAPREHSREEIENIYRNSSHIKSQRFRKLLEFHRIHYKLKICNIQKITGKMLLEDFKNNITIAQIAKKYNISDARTLHRLIFIRNVEHDIYFRSEYERIKFWSTIEKYKSLISEHVLRKEYENNSIKHIAKKYNIRERELLLLFAIYKIKLHPRYSTVCIDRLQKFEIVPVKTSKRPDNIISKELLLQEFKNRVPVRKISEKYNIDYRVLTILIFRYRIQNEIYFSHDKYRRVFWSTIEKIQSIIPRDLFYELYIERNISLRKIDRMFHIAHYRTVLLSIIYGYDYEYKFNKNK